MQLLVLLLGTLFPRRNGSVANNKMEATSCEAATPYASVGLTDRVQPYHKSVLDWLAGDEIDADMRVRMQGFVCR